MKAPQSGLIIWKCDIGTASARKASDSPSGFRGRERSGTESWSTRVRSAGETAEQGSLLGELLDPTVEDPEAARTQIFAETTGVLIARRRDKLARRGDVIGKLAGKEPLAGRRDGLLLQD